MLLSNGKEHNLIFQPSPKFLNMRLNASSSSRALQVEDNRISFVCNQVFVVGAAHSSEGEKSNDILPHMIWNCLFLGAIVDSLFQLSHFSLGTSVQIFIQAQLACIRAISEELFKALHQQLYASHQNSLKSMIGPTVKSSFWRAKRQLVTEPKRGLPWQNRAELHRARVHKEPSGGFAFMFLPMKHFPRAYVQDRECHLPLCLLGKGRRQAKNRWSE